MSRIILLDSGPLLALHLSSFPIYYSTAMKQKIQTERAAAVDAASKRPKTTREYVLSLRGKFKGKDLLKTLIKEKKKEQRF